MNVPALFKPAGRYARKWSGDVWVLSPGPIPTVDYYLAARLSNVTEKNIRHLDSNVFDSFSTLPREGTFVIIVRRSIAAWLNFLDKHQSRLSGVAYLMDDDIPAAWRCADLPVDYGVWTTWCYLRVRPLLARICDRIWVSTDALRYRYVECNVQVLKPLGFSEPRKVAPAGTRRWGYHGKRGHHRELSWLVPIVEAVQQASSEHEFEVFGGAKIARLFAHIPRVKVMPALSWPEYLEYCQFSNLAVGVAPLLPGRFNEARSYIKIFDITRCGAVGVFSNREPYAPALESAGVSLLPDDHTLWVSEILRLLADDALRFERYTQASAWVGLASRDEDFELRLSTPNYLFPLPPDVKSKL